MHRAQISDNSITAGGVNLKKKISLSYLKNNSYDLRSQVH